MELRGDPMSKPVELIQHVRSAAREVWLKKYTRVGNCVVAMLTDNEGNPVPEADFEHIAPGTWVQLRRGLWYSVANVRADKTKLFFVWMPPNMTVTITELSGVARIESPAGTTTPTDPGKMGNVWVGSSVG
jgi:hypothetical protein